MSDRRLGCLSIFVLELLVSTVGVVRPNRFPIQEEVLGYNNLWFVDGLVEASSRVFWELDHLVSFGDFVDSLLQWMCSAADFDKQETSSQLAHEKEDEIIQGQFSVGAAEFGHFSVP